MKKTSTNLTTQPEVSAFGKMLVFPCLFLLLLTFNGELTAQSCNSSSSLPPVQAVSNLSISQGTLYFVNNFHQAGAGTQFGFPLNGFEISNAAAGWTNQVGFCIELAEPLTSSSYSSGFSSINLENISRGLAGVAGTASSAIPVGGIGAERAGRVRYLFDNHYQGAASADWTNEEYGAFQLALWELSHDTDFSLIDNTGEIYLGSNGTTFDNDVRGLAQTWLDAMSALGFTSTDWGNYNTTTWTVTALEHNPNPGMSGFDDQDMVVGEACSATGGGGSSSCNCTEYIYLNDPGLDIVHKFSVDGGGAVTEIGTPWLDNINRPHGLGVDINGFLYIAREEPGPTWIIGKYTCDGGVVDANWHTTNATFIFNMNADRDGNLVYHGTLDNFSSYNHVKIDLCTATEIGCSEVPGSSTWGFYVEEDGTFWGARPTFSGSTGSAIYTGNINNFGTSPTCGTASTTFVKDDAPLDAPNYWPFGIFVDNAGFIYLVNTDPQGSGFNAFGPSYITKYAPDGTFVASSVLDDDSTDGGWFGSRGIVVDEAGLIYVSVNDGSANVATTGSTCFAIFEDDGLGNLNFVSAVNNPVGVTGTDPKAMGITKECCPTASTQTIDETVCYDGSNTTSVSLQNFLDCGDGGIICEGQWVEDPANPAAFTFNDCDLTIDVDGIGCATYTLSKGPLTGLQQCGAFNITVNVCSVTPPAYGAITSIQGTCNSSFPNDDAGIEIVSITNADIAGISSAGAATYDGPSYNSDPATNPALFAVSGGTLNISNLEHNQTYVVRLFNQGNNCFEDIVVNTATISCGGSCNCTDYIYLNDTEFE